MISPKDAATVVLLRARGDETEAFLVRRHGKSAFMGGAYVFPGGKVDDADRDVAELLPDQTIGAMEPTPGRSLSRVDAIALYSAACRELYEEAGVLIADGAVDPSWRKKLQVGEATFAEMIRSERAVPRLDRLLYFAHWITPSLEPRRFDTRFFLVELPEGQTAVHDDRETTEQAWWTTEEALARQAKGEIFLPPPTQRTLEELGSGPPSAVLSRARSRKVAAILPKVAVEEDCFSVLLPWDPDYEKTEGESVEVERPHPNESAPSRIRVTLR